MSQWTIIYSTQNAQLIHDRACWFMWWMTHPLNVYQIKHLAHGILKKLKLRNNEGELLKKSGVNQQHARLPTDHGIGLRSTFAIDCYQRLGLSTMLRHLNKALEIQSRCEIL